MSVRSARNLPTRGDVVTPRMGCQRVVVSSYLFVLPCESFEYSTNFVQGSFGDASHELLHFWQLCGRVAYFFVSSFPAHVLLLSLSQSSPRLQSWNFTLLSGLDRSVPNLRSSLDASTSHASVSIDPFRLNGGTSVLRSSASPRPSPCRFSSLPRLPDTCSDPSLFEARATHRLRRARAPAFDAHRGAEHEKNWIETCSVRSCRAFLSSSVSKGTNLPFDRVSFGGLSRMPPERKGRVRGLGPVGGQRKSFFSTDAEREGRRRTRWDATDAPCCRRSHARGRMGRDGSESMPFRMWISVGTRRISEGWVRGNDCDGFPSLANSTHQPLAWLVPCAIHQHSS